MNTMTLYEIYIIIHNVYYTLSSQLYVTMFIETQECALKLVAAI